MARRTLSLHPITRLAATIALALLFGGCSSVKKAAINQLAGAFSGGGGSVITGDEDPELIRDFLPFALKTQEILLEETPDNEALLQSTCRNYTTYSYGFIQNDADRLEMTDFRAARAQRQRAKKLYLRALDYCLRAIDLRFPGQAKTLRKDPDAVLSAATVDDVPLLQWTSLAWGGGIALALDEPEIVIDMPVARALLVKALELDEDFDDGALHDSMITVEGLPKTMGGSPERAREHYRRALELNGGTRVGTYVNLAEAVTISAQNRREFQDLLEKALAVDVEARPNERLVNIVLQQRAQMLLDQIDDLFLEPLDEGGE